MRMSADFFAVMTAFWLVPQTCPAQLLPSTPNAVVSEMGIVSYGSRDWAQCAGEEQTRPDRAIASCGRIINERISRTYTAAAYFFRARLNESQGQPERAQADFSRALETLNALVLSEPEDPLHYNNRAAVRYRTRDYDGALADYGRVVELDDTRVLPRFRRGAILFRRGDYQGAVVEFDRAAALRPEESSSQAARCEARAAANIEPDVALAACNQALRISQGSSDNLFSRGYLHFVQNRMPQAMADFAAALEADSTNPYALFGYGAVGVRMGHPVEGQTLMESAAEAEPDVAIYANAGLRP
jgi:tetratricopeptide (TPR) repeat protein